MIFFFFFARNEITGSLILFLDLASLASSASADENSRLDTLQQEKQDILEAIQALDNVAPLGQDPSVLSMSSDPSRVKHEDSEVAEGVESPLGATGERTVKGEEGNGPRAFTPQPTLDQLIDAKLVRAAEVAALEEELAKLERVEQGTECEGDGAKETNIKAAETSSCLSECQTEE